MRRGVRSGLAASLIALGTLPTAGAGAADEVRVLSAAAVQAPAEAIARTFTVETGHSVVFEFATAGQVEARLNAGAAADIVITSAERAVRLEPNADRHRALGTVRIGVAVRPGAPRPDLSSAARFTAGLQRIASLAYADPAAGSTTGIHFARVYEALPFDGPGRPRVVLGANGLDVMQRVVRGEADWGITQISEILHVAGGLLAGPLPPALQRSTTYVAIVRPTATPAARAFVDRLAAPAGAARFRAAGFE